MSRVRYDPTERFTPALSLGDRLRDAGVEAPPPPSKPDPVVPPPPAPRRARAEDLFGADLARLGPVCTPEPEEPGEGVRWCPHGPRADDSGRWELDSGPAEGCSFRRRAVAKIAAAQQVLAQAEVLAAKWAGIPVDEVVRLEGVLKEDYWTSRESREVARYGYYPGSSLEVRRIPTVALVLTDGRRARHRGHNGVWEDLLVHWSVLTRALGGREFDRPDPDEATWDGAVLFER